ncbi:MAG: 50S ribosomal protein L25 [Candidatus Heteroscillospira sp.]|jgi:large subunit ribosomal protein L25
MYTIKVQARQKQEKVKQLRRNGFVPATVYGYGMAESISVQLERGEADKMLRAHSRGAMVALDMDGRKLVCLLKCADRNQLKNEIEHIEFQKLHDNRPVNASAQIVLLNREKIPGYIGQEMFELPYCALPADLVETVAVDLCDLPKSRCVTVSDLELAKNERIEILCPGDNLVVKVSGAM